MMRKCCENSYYNTKHSICPICKESLPPFKKCGHRKYYKCCCNATQSEPTYDLITEMNLQKFRNPYANRQ
jgi:hypothetical protein